MADKTVRPSLVRPGSENVARVQEGFPRNLGDPVIDQLKAALRHGAK
jgi:hypothetical protein